MDTTDAIHVLHVDDNPDFSDIVATFLRQESDQFIIEQAINPTEARAYLTDHEVDCIISDYNMPEENGIEFLRTVRREYGDLPFILYTGKGSEEIAGDAITAGVTDYIQKKPGADHYSLLANRVRNAVRRSRAEQTVTRTRTQLDAIVEHTTDTILIIDANSTVTFANQAAKELFGYDPADLIGEPLTTIMPPRFYNAHHEGVAQYLRTGDRALDWHSIELPGQHRDGHEVPLSISFGEFERDGATRFIGILRERS